MPIRLGLGLGVQQQQKTGTGQVAGVATVTLDTSEEWSPGSVTGANPLLPLVFRLYGNGGNGGLPEEGNGGGGGGGGAFVTGTRAVWTGEDSFAINIGTPGVPGTSVAGNTPTVSDVGVLAGGGTDAAGSIPGEGSTAYATAGLTSTTTYPGGNGGAGSGAIGGGGGASGSIGGAGGAGDSGGSPGIPAAADGGDGGYGGDGDVGGAGELPGGGGGGCSDPGAEIAAGANGRVVVLVPTLT